MALLSDALRTLSLDVINIVRNFKKQGKISKIRSPWVRKVVIGFHYDEVGGLMYSTTYERFEKEIWDPRDLSQLVELIKSLSIYIKARDIVAKNYNLPLHSADFYLEWLTYNIVLNAVEDTLDERKVDGLISLFLNDLENKPCYHKAEVLLGGIILKNEVLDIREGLRLRKPTPNDLSFECPLDLLLWIKPSEPIMTPTAVLEAIHAAQSPSEVEEYIERILFALKLYKPCSIVKIEATFKPVSILRSPVMEFPMTVPSIAYRCTLSSNELEHLRTFLATVEPLLPITWRRIEPQEYISISLQRYNDALFKSDSVESLAYAIMGLEALYLTELSELSHRLAQRVAKIMGLLGFDPREVYKEIKDAYNIRSKFIHGASYTKREIDDASRLVNKVIKYLQLSILTFLELKHVAKKDKREAIELIDASMIDPLSEEKLRDIIDENCQATLMISRRETAPT
jgi:hypothetical protein